MDKSINKRLKKLEITQSAKAGVEIWKIDEKGICKLCNSDIVLNETELEQRMENYPGVVYILDDIRKWLD